MLVLSLKAGEKVKFGRDITVKVLETNSGRMRIGIEAPSSVRIERVADKLNKKNLKTEDNLVQKEKI